MNDYKIKELYEQMEMELIDSMKRNLSRHLTEEDEVGFKYPQWQALKLKELKRYQRENKKIIGGYVKGLNKEISDHLKVELKQGTIRAIKQYNSLTGSNKNINKVLNKSFFRTNDKKVNALINAINNELNKANTGALRMINDEYRQIIFKSAFFVANGVKTEKQAATIAENEISQKKATMLACDNVSKTFLAGGLNCVEYKNGRRVNIASYAAMAVRTANTRAHLMGEGNFRKSIGKTLVKVTTHGGSCPLCSKWQGKILIDDVYSGGKKEDGPYQLLSEAMDQGFLHPNCRDGITTYYPELENVKYDKNEEDEYLSEEAKKKLQYLDLNIQQFARKERGSITAERIKEYKLKKEELLNKKKRFLELYNNHRIREYNKLPYEDITEEMMKEAISNAKEPENVFEYTKILEDGRKIKYDSSNAKFDPKGPDKNEKRTINTLKEKLGWNIDIIHRINSPDGISVPDIRRNNKDYWDIKNFEASSSENARRSKLFNAVRKKKEQTNKFVLDLNNSGCDVSNEEALRQIDRIFKEINWVEQIVLLGKENLILIFKRK